MATAPTQAPTPAPAAAKPAQPETPAVEVEASSFPEEVESITKKQFYTSEGALLEPGTPYVFRFSELHQVYPWPILEPVDETLHKALKKQYTDFFAEQQAQFSSATERSRLLSRLAEIGA